MDENPYQSPRGREEDPTESKDMYASAEFLYLCWGVANVLAIPFLVFYVQTLSLDFYGNDLLRRPIFWLYQAIAWVLANSMFVFAKFVEGSFPCSNMTIFMVRVGLVSIATIFFGVAFFMSVSVAARLSM